MAKSGNVTTMKVPSWFKKWIKAHKHSDETMFEAWQRLSGGPPPREVVGLLSDEQAVTMLDRIEAKSDRSKQSQCRHREGFDES